MTPNRRLKQARELRGWSQAKIAELIGTDATTVSRWERGLFYPTPYFREKLCVLFAKNAEELGLLEAVCLPEKTPSSPQASSDPPTGTITPLIPPSWPERTDTFAYILHSAAHDQQAHILWEDAYVRSLRGQIKEAQQLGEASMSAFERVGHLNAAAIREWLSQWDRSSTSQTSVPPLSPTTRAAQGKQSARHFTRTIKSGLTLFLLLVSVLMASAFVWSRSSSLIAQTSAYAASGSPANAQAATTVAQVPKTGTMGRSIPTPIPPSASAGNIGDSHPAAIASPTATNVQPSSVPTATPTPTPRAPSVSASSSITTTTLPLSARILPTSLSPRICYAEPIGNRCTLTVWLIGSSNDTYTWSASSNVAVQINPTGGTGTIGQPLQIIVYVQDAPGQDGQIVFSFHTSRGDCTAMSTWHG